MVTKALIILCATCLVACPTGCNVGPWGKRSQELCCPTDIRKMHHWCWGEDAIIDTPCGVDEAYHGHKPTCWRDWQAPATVWRDEHCGAPCLVEEAVTYPIETINRPEAPATEVLPDLDSSTPPDPTPDVEQVEPLSYGKSYESLLKVAAVAPGPSQPINRWDKSMPFVSEPPSQKEDGVDSLEDQPSPKRLPAEKSFGFRIVN